MKGNKKLEENEIITGGLEKVPSLLTNPLTTIVIFTKSVTEDLMNFAVKYKKALQGLSVLLALYLVSHFIPSVEPYIEKADEIMLFCGFWIGLGILSSIGLGTGLHTFVLYLAPKIIRLVTASYECDAVAQMIPSRFSISPAFACPANASVIKTLFGAQDPLNTDGSIFGGNELTFWNLFRAIQLESFLWGLGTALGELPPYLISKAARLAGRTAEDMEEIEQEMKDKNDFFTRIKRKVCALVEKNAFLTVTLLASIPNPLFDLAGITCGHLLVPFTTFLAATVIGKAVVKVHLQVLVLIFLSSKKQVNFAIQYIKDKISPVLGEKLFAAIKSQRQNLLTDPDSEQESAAGFLATLWNFLLFGMISYFVVSIINSKVKAYCLQPKVKDK